MEIYTSPTYSLLINHLRHSQQLFVNFSLLFCHHKEQQRGKNTQTHERLFAKNTQTRNTPSHKHLHQNRAQKSPHGHHLPTFGTAFFASRRTHTTNKDCKILLPKTRKQGS
jgi:hypothetical protein